VSRVPSPDFGAADLGELTSLLGGRCPSVVATTDSCASPVWFSSPSALASCEESLPVATSPGYQRHLPDVISANPSSDVWPHATAVPQGARACFFPYVIGLPQQERGSASRFTREHDFSTERFSTLQTFLNVQTSEFARLPDRSYRCAYRRWAAETFTSGHRVLRCLHTLRIC
jgi:hypothetical protein